MKKKNFKSMQVDLRRMVCKRSKLELLAISREKEYDLDRET
jgi:hypothetical protein